jgi:ribosomal protein S18 acetylase RimI-like enzyme
MDDDYVAEVANGTVHVLEHDGRVVGLIVLLACDDHVLVQNVAVAPGCQGQGYGGELLAFAEREAVRAGVPEMRLYTHEKMDTNIAWYTRHGWVVQSRAEQDTFRRVFFAKRVGAAA